MHNNFYRGLQTPHFLHVCSQVPQARPCCPLPVLLVGCGRGHRSPPWAGTSGAAEREFNSQPQQPGTRVVQFQASGGSPRFPLRFYDPSQKSLGSVLSPFRSLSSAPGSAQLPGIRSCQIHPWAGERAARGAPGELWCFQVTGEGAQGAHKPGRAFFSL